MNELKRGGAFGLMLYVVGSRLARHVSESALPVAASFAAPTASLLPKSRTRPDLALDVGTFTNPFSLSVCLSVLATHSRLTSGGDGVTERVRLSTLQLASMEGEAHLAQSATPTMPPRMQAAYHTAAAVAVPSTPTAASYVAPYLSSRASLCLCRFSSV
jgi:hypothetical protein